MGHLRQNICLLDFGFHIPTEELHQNLYPLFGRQNLRDHGFQSEEGTLRDLYPCRLVGVRNSSSLTCAKSVWFPDGFLSDVCCRCLWTVAVQFPNLSYRQLPFLVRFFFFFFSQYQAASRRICGTSTCALIVGRLIKFWMAVFGSRAVGVASHRHVPLPKRFSVPRCGRQG